MTTVLDKSDQPNVTMYDIVCHWADRTPDAPALIADGQAPFCYRDLRRSIDAIGAELGAFGIGRTDRVAIVHPGGADMAAAVMGIWSYATAAPLNPDHTVGEFAVYMQDLRVNALAIAEGMETPAREAADRLGLPVFEIGAICGRKPETAILKGRAVGAAVRPCPAETDDVLLLLTTSGTTSQSKVVPVRHRNLSSRCPNVADRLELTPGDRCLNLMPLFHSHGLSSGLAAPIFSGGSAIMMPDFDVNRFFRQIETFEPTWYTAVFTFHHQIHAHAKSHEEAIAQSRLRFIHTSSGRMDPKIGADLESWFNVPMIGTYASTETGIVSGDSLPPALRKPSSVGTSAGSEIAILDEDRQRVPAGVRGEVFVRGPNIVDGYENVDTPALTPDGWFGTGDEGVLDEDGFLFLTGRIKELINRGGEKISPSEVDNALLDHPDVAAATTFAIPHPTLGEEVAAAVVLNEDAAISDKALADFLRVRLADFKVPRRILMVDDIPKNFTGKIQRHTLAAAFGLNGGDAAIGEAGQRDTVAKDRPQPSALEAQLAALWADALGLNHVGLDDDFFLLGGDSLQAVELFMRVEAAFGQRLPRSALFEAGTVSEMARRIEAAVPSTSVVPVQPDGDRPPFFCVHGGTGEVLNFRPLAKRLGPSQPFYAIQAAGLDGTALPPVRVEELAAEYIREIKKVQPTGPYYLGGFSFGGRVAYVMARQLREAGERVGLLALLDPFSGLGRHRVELGPWLVSQWRVVRGLGPAAMPGYMWRRVRRFSGRMATRGRLFGVRLALRHFQGQEDALPGFLRRPEDRLTLAHESYRPMPYDGSAVLFQAQRNIRTHADAHAGWHKLVRGGLEVFPMPCSHSQIMEEPYVREMADVLINRMNGEAREPEQRIRVEA